MQEQTAQRQIIVIPHNEQLTAEFKSLRLESFQPLADLLWKHLQGTGVTVAECKNWASLHILQDESVYINEVTGLWYGITLLINTAVWVA